MLRIEQYDTTIRELNRQKLGATSDESRQAWDWTWSNMLQARCHAFLVARFDEQSAFMRNNAARLSSRPGGAREAESMRLRSAELHEIAERHRAAADEFQEEAEAALGDCRALSQRDQQAREQEQQQQQQQPGDQQRQGERQERRQARQRGWVGRNTQPQEDRVQEEQQPHPQE